MSNFLGRPSSVTWLAIGVLMLTGWSILRFSAALQQWEFLSSLSLPLSPLYQALSGLIWGAASFAIALGLWFGWHWAQNGTRIAAAVYTIQLWVERLIFAQSATVKQNMGFILVFNFAALLSIYLILALPKVQIFFGENNERKPELED